MTILHLDSGREMRGGQWQVLRLMRGLRKRGHQSILLARAKGPLLDGARREHFRCDINAPTSVWTASRQAQIVHAHDAHSHTLAVLFARKPVVVSRRVIFPVGHGVFSKWKYSRPRKYAAISNAVAQQLTRAGVREQRIEVIYDGVPLLPITWRTGGPMVIPRFNDSRKGNKLPIEAAREAGVPLIRSTNLENDLEGASALLYITDSEGLGSAALMAMSAGVPVIASAVGGLKEVVKHGENGLLVENTLPSIVAAIRALRSSEQEAAQRMSRNARQTVADRFSEDRMVDQTLRLYGTVLNDG